MKKVLMTMVVVLAIVACSSSPYGQGGENACQFVKEQIPGLRDDIAKVEVIREDSLLSDEFLPSGELELRKGEVDYYEKRITRDKLDSIIRNVSCKLNDVESSWRFGDVVNDSLRKLEKYNYWWRKVYTVRVTMKSGTTKDPRVMMMENGVTPSCIEKDVENNIKKHVDALMDVVTNIIY